MMLYSEPTMTGLMSTGLKMVAVAGGAYAVYKSGIMSKFVKLLYRNKPKSNVSDCEDELTEELVQLFEQACDEFIPVAPHLPQDEALWFYARYKQATEGPCRNLLPPVSNSSALAKWKSWRSVGEMSCAEAMHEYVDQFETLMLDFDRQFDQTDSAADKTFGVGISRPKRATESNSDDPVSQWFASVSQGQFDKVHSLLLSSKAPYQLLRCRNAENEDNLTALHIAADRGFSDICALLIESGANINALDVDDQTPLHYACACDHVDTVRLLLQQGADLYKHDASGTTPIQLAETNEMKSLVNLFAK